jgi:hypothetical protein
MIVIINPEVRRYFYELQYILYEKDYFGFLEAAKKYVNELLDDIKKNLPIKTKKTAPKYFTDQFGKGLYYATFTKNKRTQWYAFFRIYKISGEIYYQVRHIENNHTAAHLI